MGKKGREKIRVLLVLIFWEKKVGKKLGYFRISEFLILENYDINYNSKKGRYNPVVVGSVVVGNH